MKNEVGLKSIAMELGVSLTTVSRALSDAPDISEATKAKVRKKAIELRYTPNQFAKSLSTGRSNIIAIFVDSLRSPYFSLVLEMMARKIKNEGYSISLFPLDHAYTEKEDVKTAIATGVAAIISFTIPKQDAIETATLSQRPLLLFGRGCDDINVNVIYTDDVEGGRIAAELLHRRGHDKLLYLSGGVNEVSNYRLEGFSSYCRENNIPYRVLSEDFANFQALYDQGYDGIFAFDDQLASTFRWGFKDKAIDIVGFNGLKKYGLTPDGYMPFPSVSGDYDAMVNEAIDTIIQQIKSDSSQCVKRKFPVTIIE